MDSSLARNGIKVDSGFLARHIQKFVGKPVILTPHKNHSKEFMRYKQTGSPAIDVAELMKLQEKHRISRIVSVHPTNVQQASSDNQRYTAIIELDTQKGINLYKHGLLPKYVSPSIYKINDDTTDNITNYEPLHLALVSAPAYGFKAHIRKSCKDTEPICMNQLAQTALDKANQGKILLDRLLAFSGIDGMYIPIPGTFGHNHIWNNSARVAAGSGASINTNLSTPQKRIQQLNKLLFFTKQ